MGTTEHDSAVSARRKGKHASFAWAMRDLMSAAGRVSIGVVVLFLILVGLRQTTPIGKSLDKMLPAPVARWLNEDSKKGPRPETSSSTARELSKVIPPAASTPQPAGFGVGSSEEDVRALQGPPARSAPGVWFYGESEVHFVGGRVVSWRSSPRNPLRLR